MFGVVAVHCRYPKTVVHSQSVGSQQARIKTCFANGDRFTPPNHTSLRFVGSRG